VPFSGDDEDHGPRGGEEEGGGGGEEEAPESCKVVAEPREILASLEQTATLAAALRARFVPKDPFATTSTSTSTSTSTNAAAEEDVGLAAVDNDAMNDAPMFGDFEDLEVQPHGDRMHVDGAEEEEEEEEEEEDEDEDDEVVQVMNAEATRAALAEKKLQLKAQFDAAYDDQKAGGSVDAVDLEEEEEEDSSAAADGSAITGGSSHRTRCATSYVVCGFRLWKS
jgi:hypothetical protein